MNVSDKLRKRCDAFLVALLGEHNVQGWWNSKNRAFDMRTAQEQWELDPQVVYNYLMGHALR
jgi:hypothetical protein